MDDFIPFTQYLRPDGRQIMVQAPMPTGYDVRVEAILDHGWEFECEVLTSGHVSLTVSDGDEDVAGPFIGPNDDEAVMNNLKQLIVQATARLNEEVLDG